MSLKRRKPNHVVGKGIESGITALIDMDIIVYSCGFAAQHNIHEVTINGEDQPRATFTHKRPLKEWVEQNGIPADSYSVTTRIEADSVENTLHSVKVFLNGILEATNAQYYKGYLTGKGNFREKIATILPYKGNRVLPKPIHYDTIREYLIKHWGAIVVEGMEADDMLAIKQSMLLALHPHEGTLWEGYDRANTVICSIDKDLRQVPGWHYNWNKDEAPVWISEQEGMYNFYKQLLTGDKTDNIQGIKNIGDKKAGNILNDCVSEEDMFWSCLCAYECSDYKRPLEAMIENAKLLWMLREVGDEWKPKW